MPIKEKDVTTQTIRFEEEEVEKDIEEEEIDTKEEAKDIKEESTGIKEEDTGIKEEEIELESIEEEKLVTKELNFNKKINITKVYIPQKIDLSENNSTEDHTVKISMIITDEGLSKINNSSVIEEKNFSSEEEVLPEIPSESKIEKPKESIIEKPIEKFHEETIIRNISIPYHPKHPKISTVEDETKSENILENSKTKQDEVEVENKIRIKTGDVDIRKNITVVDIHSSENTNTTSKHPIKKYPAYEVPDDAHMNTTITSVEIPVYPEADSSWTVWLKSEKAKIFWIYIGGTIIGLCFLGCIVAWWWKIKELFTSENKYNEFEDEKQFDNKNVRENFESFKFNGDPQGKLKEKEVKNNEMEPEIFYRNKYSQENTENLRALDLKLDLESQPEDQKMEEARQKAIDRLDLDYSYRDSNEGTERPEIEVSFV